MPHLNRFTMIIFFALFCFSLGGQAASPIKTTQKTIVLDPGHGGGQKGISISNTLPEKDLTLQIALKTAKILEKKYNVFLTRKKDTDISQIQRISFANQNHPDLFIALHISGAGRGPGFFYDLRDSTKSVGQNDSYLWEQRQSFHSPKSKIAAEMFAKIFTENVKDGPFIISGVPLAALKGCDAPAVLIEPVSASSISRTLKQIDPVLDNTADLIAGSVDLYFKKIKSNR